MTASREGIIRGLRLAGFGVVLLLLAIILVRWSAEFAKNAEPSTPARQVPAKLPHAKAGAAKSNGYTPPPPPNKGSRPAAEAGDF
jgi:hypothetical protein